MVVTDKWEKIQLMDDYKIIVEQEHSTVMAHYEVEPKPAEGYQSEAKLER